jgi:hypothetical protein
MFGTIVNRLPEATTETHRTRVFSHHVVAAGIYSHAAG